MNLKAQISVEFVIVLVLLFSLFLFSLFVFKEKQSGLIFSKEQMETKLVANKIARTINSVFLAGNGATSKLLLEKKIDYSIDFFGNSVWIGWKQNYSTAALLTDDVSAGAISAGNLVLIENRDGGIIIETV